MPFSLRTTQPSSKIKNITQAVLTEVLHEPIKKS